MNRGHPKLIELIQQHIKTAGAIPFNQFMALALYAKDVGYYQNPEQVKFGKQGDFVTAPEISTLFAKTLANQIIPIFDELGERVIAEFGAGSGQMAVDLLQALEANNVLIERYVIIEISESLKQQQQLLFQEKIPHLLARISWQSELPEQFIGVVIANEVLDALPIHRFQIANHQLYECFVTEKDDQFVWQLQNIQNTELNEKLSAIQQNFLSDVLHYQSEINLAIKDWIDALSRRFKRGVVLLFDYGYARKEYYLPERNQGTLLCYYQHQVHDNPLICVGEQDITAHVDFTSVAEAAFDNEFWILGYTTQAYFLLANGITDFLEHLDVSSKERIILNQQVKKLIQPHEMGEIMKVMALGREFETPLQGFGLLDLRSRL